jgi:hypothetical protein
MLASFWCVVFFSACGERCLGVRVKPPSWATQHHTGRGERQEKTVIRPGHLITIIQVASTHPLSLPPVPPFPPQTHHSALTTTMRAAALCRGNAAVAWRCSTRQLAHTGPGRTLGPCSPRASPLYSGGSVRAAARRGLGSLQQDRHATSCHAHLLFSLARAPLTTCPLQLAGAATAARLQQQVGLGVAHTRHAITTCEGV